MSDCIKDKFSGNEIASLSKEDFEKTVPAFSINVNGNQITVSTIPIPGANMYEVLRSEKARSGYQMVVSGTSPILTFYNPEEKTYYYKVKAVRIENGTRIETKESKHQVFDIVLAAKKRQEKMLSFFNTLNGMKDTLTYEDLDIAMETLKVATLELREREERKRLEAEAEIQRKKIEAENKRRQAAAQRAAERREKNRIQHVEEVTRMEIPLGWTNCFENDERVSEHCESVSDGLMLSLDMLGMVDIEFISSVTGEGLKDVINGLKGAIYQNPLHWGEVFYKGWETADEYLSGNICHKLKTAREANETYNGYFEENVKALERLVDEDISTDDIYISLGSPWIPTDIIDDFIFYMAFSGNINSKEAYEYMTESQSSQYAVRHDEITGRWEIPEKGRFRKSVFHGMFEKASYETFGTDRIDMMTILENTLNMKTISVYDTDPNNNKKRIINQDETIKALGKQEYMINTFREWVWEDETRKNRLQSAYIRKYGNIRKRIFDGSFLEFPGMSKDICLYDYQKNAVARILFSPNTLLAHDVGSGKTYAMIAAGMELRRLGKSKKNLYVVPNGIIGQWESIFKAMYPESKLLVITSKVFDSKHRNNTLLKIKDEDYDAILMTYSCFDMLPLSEKYYIELYKERLAILDKASNHFVRTGNIDRKKKIIEEAISKLQKTYRKKPKCICFDELGISTLFLDEAHNYKNIDLDSHISRVRGFNTSGSTRGNGMLDKVHYIQRHNNGGRIVFATGTPITNSLSDIFVMQKYLQEGELEFQGINTFDSWAGMFADKTTDFEIDVDTNNYRLVTRFSRFCNLPELTSMLSSIVDFHQIDKSAGIPEIEGYDDSTEDGSQDFKDYLKDISNRADDVRMKRVDVKTDNMLKITSDGRKAALDMRLIDEAFGLEINSKVMRCAENISEIYNATRENKSTQLVFCDISTPKPGFNLYDELKNLLKAMGIPDKEIAFVHDYDSDAKRKELFKKVREGNIAVLIGSTQKMGHGMNVQDRLYAIHHLDVPWRPSDMIQREGRILRQGNTNTKVKIFRYITKASFDAYSWQLLETKQRFISQIMTGSSPERDGTDIDDTVLNYSEVKALAVGNPKIKRRVEVKNELDKYRILKHSFIEDMRKKEHIVETYPGIIETQKERILSCEKDIQEYASLNKSYSEMSYKEQSEIREQIYTALQRNMNSPKEHTILTYQGFKVVVPPFMVPKAKSRKPESEKTDGDEELEKSKSIFYVHLVKNGTYYLEIESKSGITKRLNNFLGKLSDKKNEMEESLITIENKYNAAVNDLHESRFEYNDKIDELKEELEELNRELGVA